MNSQELIEELWNEYGDSTEEGKQIAEDFWSWIDDDQEFTAWDMLGYCDQNRGQVPDLGFGFMLFSEWIENIIFDANISKVLGAEEGVNIYGYVMKDKEWVRT